MNAAFAKTLQRDDVRITPLPDARTVTRLVDGWITEALLQNSRREGFTPRMHAVRRAA